VGGIGVGVGGTGVAVAVGGMGVGVGGMGVSVSGGGVAVGDGKVAVGGTDVAVGSAVVGGAVVHPAKTISATISDMHRNRGFISISSTNGILFNLHFKYADPVEPLFCIVASAEFPFAYSTTSGLGAQARMSSTYTVAESFLPVAQTKMCIELAVSGMAAVSETLIQSWSPETGGGYR
jgi:hypothetical protein